MTAYTPPDHTFPNDTAPDYAADPDGPLGLEEEIPLVANAFAALGSAHRVSIILALVRVGPDGMAMGELGDRVGLSGSVLTHHLRPLVSAGLVHQRRDGRRILSYVNHPLIEDLSHFLLAECCVESCTAARRTGDQNG